MAFTFRIRCRASEDLTLAVVRGKPILTKADGRDDRQVGSLPSPLFLASFFRLELLHGQCTSLFLHFFFVERNVLIFPSCAAFALAWVM